VAHSRVKNCGHTLGRARPSAGLYSAVKNLLHGGQGRGGGQTGDGPRWRVPRPGRQNTRRCPQWPLHLHRGLLHSLPLHIADPKSQPGFNPKHWEIAGYREVGSGNQFEGGRKAGGVGSPWLVICRRGPIPIHSHCFERASHFQISK
jgi:hypothetical protein